jgi:hypothetical protein
MQPAPRSKYGSIGYVPRGAGGDGDVLFSKFEQESFGKRFYTQIRLESANVEGKQGHVLVFDGVERGYGIILDDLKTKMPDIVKELVQRNITLLGWVVPEGNAVFDIQNWQRTRPFENSQPPSQAGGGAAASASPAAGGEDVRGAAAAPVPPPTTDQESIPLVRPDEMTGSDFQQPAAPAAAPVAAAPAAGSGAVATAAPRVSLPGQERRAPITFNEFAEFAEKQKGFTGIKEFIAIERENYGLRLQFRKPSGQPRVGGEQAKDVRQRYINLISIDGRLPDGVSIIRGDDENLLFSPNCDLDAINRHFQAESETSFASASAAVGDEAVVSAAPAGDEAFAVGAAIQQPVAAEDAAVSAAQPVAAGGAAASAARGVADAGASTPKPVELRMLGPDGRNLPLEISEDQTIADLKGKLRIIFAIPENVANDQIRIMHEGSGFDDDTYPLNANDIKSLRRANSIHFYIEGKSPPSGPIRINYGEELRSPPRSASPAEGAAASAAVEASRPQRLEAQVFIHGLGDSKNSLITVRKDQKISDIKKQLMKSFNLDPSVTEDQLFVIRRGSEFFTDEDTISQNDINTLSKSSTLFVLVRNSRADQPAASAPQPPPAPSDGTNLGADSGAAASSPPPQ